MLLAGLDVGTTSVKGLLVAPDGEVVACVRPDEVVEPVPGWIEPYREARERFRALYPALHPRR